MTWNPFAGWKSRATHDRELYRETLLAITAMCSEAFKVQAAQQESLKAFLDGYAVKGEPEIRDYDDAAVERRYADKVAQRSGTMSVPEGMNYALSQIGAYEALIDKLESSI